jgi:hypothetical protein
MPNDTAYFDSQASAAATLKIDIRDIREAKKAGCPAFRSGRVYEKPLVKWLAHNKSKRTKRKIDSPDDEPRHALCEAMISLAKRFDGGLITSGEYFDHCALLIGLRGRFS